MPSSENVLTSKGLQGPKGGCPPPHWYHTPYYLHLNRCQIPPYTSAGGEEFLTTPTNSDKDFNMWFSNANVFFIAPTPLQNSQKASETLLIFVLPGPYCCTVFPRMQTMTPLLRSHPTSSRVVQKRLHGIQPSNSTSIIGNTTSQSDDPFSKLISEIRGPVGLCIEVLVFRREVFQERAGLCIKQLLLFLCARL